MLTDKTATAARPEPELAPLVIGSPLARALHDLWVGHHSVAFTVTDRTERLEATATVAVHLARLAEMWVAVRVAHVRDRRPLLEMLVEQLPQKAVASPNFGTSWPADIHHWPVLELPAHALFGVTVTVGNNDFPVGHQIVVLPAAEDHPPLTSGSRSVTIAKADSELPDGSNHRLRLGDLPLAIAIAGAPE